MTKFYVTEGVLCRERPRRPSESYGEKDGWGPYPDLNPLTDARRISRDEAKSLLPADADESMLDAPGGTDGQATVPLAPPGTL